MWKDPETECLRPIEALSEADPLLNCERLQASRNPALNTAFNALRG